MLNQQLHRIHLVVEHSNGNSGAKNMSRIGHSLHEIGAKFHYEITYGKSGSPEVVLRQIEMQAIRFTSSHTTAPEH